MEKKQFAVLGLGRFGSTLACELAEYGHDVIAMDSDMTLVEEASGSIAMCAKGDVTNLNDLKEMGVGECDAVVIAIGSHLESEIMAVLNCRQLGVGRIIVKAMNDTHRDILLKIGADEVIQPEKEMATKLAKSRSYQNFVDYVEVDDDYSIVEMKVPESWIGKSIAQLNLRNRYGINVLGIKETKDARLSVNYSIKKPLEEDNYVLMIVQEEELRRHNGF